MKNVPSVEPQTSAAGSALNVNARNPRYSSASSAERDSKQFSDLLDQTAPPENGGTPPSSRRTERTGRQDSREPARTRDSDPPASNSPAADQQPSEPSRTPSEPAVAGPNKGDAAAIVPAKSEPATEPEIAEDQDTSIPDAAVVTVAAVPVVPVAPPPVSPAAAVPVEVDAEQASGAAAVAAAASGDQPSKPLPTDTAAGDDKAAGAAGAAPAEPAAAPTQKVDKPADSAGPAAPATKPEARPGAQEAVPAETGKTGEPRSASREEPSAAQHEARTAKPTAGGAEAATRNVDAGPRHDQPAASSHAGLEQLQTVGAGPLTATTAANAAAATPAAASQAPATAIPIASVAVEIAARAQAGNNRFEIRLDPPELGRIDVKLDVDRHGNVTSHLVVERSQTLDLLRRDAPQLERALNDAGLKTGDGAMQFSLRDQGANADRDPRPARLPPVSGIGAQAAEPAPVTSVRNYRWSGTVGGVDIRV
ncbi:flagellar hook-length control protein FliK [Xanthobacteraceae bacterium Astr-EGSB]|uniref:flagellar hook-length control protein FliK n=1 Tax=Astrobacterium formosum TaxID=3069710 RepID=UPI0027B3CCE0|nr:flagellar hook-length control protein FliK [Xanthobacteraceae bacterium Astr-EGSB]